MQVFRCTFAGCPKWFYGKSQLKMHLASHEEEGEADNEDAEEVGSRGSRRVSERRGLDIEERVKVRHTVPNGGDVAMEDAAGSSSSSSKGKGSAGNKGSGSGAGKSGSSSGQQSSQQQRGSNGTTASSSAKPQSGSKKSAAASEDASGSDDSDDERKKIVFEQPNKDGTLLVNGVATYPLCTYPKCNRWFYTKGQLRSHLKSAHGIDMEGETPTTGSASASATDAKPARASRAASLDAEDSDKGGETIRESAKRAAAKGKGKPDQQPRKVKVEASESEADSAKLANQSAGESDSTAAPAQPKKKVAKLRATEGRGVSASWAMGERPQRSMSPEEKDKKRRSEVDDLLTLDDFPKCRHPGCDKWFYSRGQLKAHERLHQEEEEAAAAARAAGIELGGQREGEAEGAANGSAAAAKPPKPPKVKPAPVVKAPRAERWVLKIGASRSLII